MMLTLPPTEDDKKNITIAEFLGMEDIAYTGNGHGQWSDWSAWDSIEGEITVPKFTECKNAVRNAVFAAGEYFSLLYDAEVEDYSNEKCIFPEDFTAMECVDLFLKAILVFTSEKN